MLRIIEFLTRYRVFFSFIILELIAVSAVINRNSYQDASFHMLSLQVSSQVDQARWSLTRLLKLEETNRDLMESNARLYETLSKNTRPPERSDLPPELLNRYFFVPARVINQSTDRMKNFLTLNKGISEGLKSGMGVLSSKGIVGKVTQVSSHFATVQTILNPDFLIPGQVSRDRILGSVKWDGVNIYQSKFLFIPKHLEVYQGDTVITSGFNTLYPPGFPIGIVSQVDRSEDLSYLDIVIQIQHDFKKSDVVYVVGDRLKEEKEILEKLTEEESL